MNNSCDRQCLVSPSLSLREIQQQDCIGIEASIRNKGFNSIALAFKQWKLIFICWLSYVTIARLTDYAVYTPRKSAQRGLKDDKNATCIWAVSFQDGKICWQISNFTCRNIYFVKHKWALNVVNDLWASANDNFNWWFGDFWWINQIKSIIALEWLSGSESLAFRHCGSKDKFTRSANQRLSSTGPTSRWRSGR